MPSFYAHSHPFTVVWVALTLIACAIMPAALAQDPPAPPQTPAAPPQTPAPQAPAPPQTQTPAPQTPAPPKAPKPAPKYDTSIFQNEIDGEQLLFLEKFDNVPSGDLYRDPQFRKLLKSIVPDCLIHYGRDRLLTEVLDTELIGSKVPVQVRDERYVLLSGAMAKPAGGRAFLWIDMEDGIGLGGFEFSPTGGEPSPALDIFSKQVKEDYVAMSQLPPDFAVDLGDWSTTNSLPPVTARYFLTGANKKILLAHDENYCVSADGKPLAPESGCQQTAADAADMDLTEAYYLDATHHATNAATWTKSQDQVAFTEIRDKMCHAGSDPLSCMIRMSKDRTQIVVTRGPTPKPRH